VGGIGRRIAVQGQPRQKGKALSERKITKKTLKAKEPGVWLNQ
jgi:hypothetical protein